MAQPQTPMPRRGTTGRWTGVAIRSGTNCAVAPDRITILDVVNAVAPLQRIRECPLGLSGHTRLCPLHTELDKAYADTERAFSRVTIARLVRSTSPIVPLCEVK